nr:MAG TPA: hypothetical protein [Caudoviricetes sp.]
MMLSHLHFTLLLGLLGSKYIILSLSLVVEPSSN